MGLFGKSKKKDESVGGVEITLEDGSVIRVAEVIDCIGDSCPRPQLMTKAALNRIQPGETIEVKIDNPTSVEAIPPMLPELGATLVSNLRKDRHWQVLVRRN